MRPFHRGTAQQKRSASVLFSVAALACCLNSASLGATPTIAYVQGNYSAPQSPQTTVTVTFTAAQAAGDLNVVVVGWNDSTALVNAVSDIRGNAYTRAVGPTVISGALSQSIYYAKNIAPASAGANAVTVTFSAPAIYADIRILEYSGADPANPVDVTAANSGSGVSSNSGSATTTNAADLVFGANIVTTTTAGPGSGFIGRLLTSPDGDIAEDQMVTAVGSYSATAPLGSSGLWIMQMVAFKAAGSGSACDLNADATVNVLDVQLATAMNLGSLPCTVTIGGAAVCTVALVNTVTTSAIGGGCVTPVLSTPSSISFGNVVVGGSSSQSFQLSVAGTGSTTISQATVAGAGFSIDGLSLPLTLAAGQSASFNVVFAPAIAGAASGSVTLTSNALNSSVNIALSGTGVTSISHNVLLSWTASTSASIAGYNIYRITSSSQTPPSPPYSKLNSSLVSGTGYTDASVVAGQQYYYYATAVDTSNAESIPSNTTPAVVPSP